MQEKLNDINAWWAGEGAKFTQIERGAAEVLKDLGAQKKALDNLKSGLNPWLFLKNAWYKANQRGVIEKEISVQRQTQQDYWDSLTETARANVELICDAYLASDAAHAGLKQVMQQNKQEYDNLTARYDLLNEINKKTNDVLKKVKRAWRECDDAQDYETLDMVGSSPLFTILSDGETREAAKYLNAAVEAIKDYSEYMERAKGEPFMVEAGVDIDGLLSAAEWDLWFGVFDLDVLSFFSSWNNSQKLGEAKKQLSDVQAHIEPIGAEINQRISNTLAARQDVAAKRDDVQAEILAKFDVPENMKFYFEEIRIYPAAVKGLPTLKLDM